MKRLTLVLLALSAAVIPATADATPLPGPPGPFIITSSRTPLAGDSTSGIWYLSSPGGTPSKVTTADTLHHRHATWSPDRTKIAYAQSTAANYLSGPWNIYVQDLKNGGSPVLLANGHDERPSWSPDGTRIAYQEWDGAADWVIKTKPANGTVASVATTVATNLGGASGDSKFYRPNWSADSQTIYYGKFIGAADYDIYKAPADGSDTAGTGVVTGSTNDFQPATSADGTQLCFTRDLGGTPKKDVYVVPTAGGLPADLLPATTTDEYECAWAPDNSKIAYVQGGFGLGLIWMRNADGSGLASVANDPGDNRFDGNPEWAPNPSPTCNSTSKQVAVNGFVSIPLSCSDQPDPPSYLDNEVQSVDIVTPPAHGVLGGIINDKSVIYTPNVNFSGTDSFTYNATDGTSESTVAKATITVGNPAGGDKTAPTAKLSGSTKQNLARQKAVIVTVQPNEACALSATGRLSVPGASKSFKLRKASANAAANAKVKLRLKISSKGVRAIRKAVKKRKRVKASISIIAKDAAGNSASFKRTVRAKAK